MNKLHKLTNQPITEFYTYCGDIDTYIITLVKYQLPGGSTLIESWYAEEGDGIAHHACGVAKDTEENRAILINEAIELIKQYELDLIKREQTYEN